MLICIICRPDHMPSCIVLVKSGTIFKVRKKTELSQGCLAKYISMIKVWLSALKTDYSADSKIHIFCLFLSLEFEKLPSELGYRTRAIITRGLYLFYPIFHCGLYLREVYIAERLVITWFFFHLKSPEKKIE